MFRWCADGGPKVVPLVDQMKDYFGFKAQPLPADDLEVVLRSDAHPGNWWCHTVARFPNVTAVHTLLSREQLQQQDVLWVRFAEEDPEFDYEKVAGRWTYHNCRTDDAQNISDKYIKGQDFPVVVIEGFPRFMDAWQSEEAEAKMWAFRRELYLCASRSTGFLYFVCNVTTTKEVSRIQREIDSLIEAVSAPEDRATSGTRSWKLIIKHTTTLRRLEVFADAEGPSRPEELQGRGVRQPVTDLISTPKTIKTFESLKTGDVAPAAKQSGQKQEAPRAPTKSELRRQSKRDRLPQHLENAPIIRFPRNGTVKHLAAELGLKPFQLIKELMDYGHFVRDNEPLSERAARMLCERHLFRMQTSRA
jgi:hypothetical protein